MFKYIGKYTTIKKTEAKKMEEMRIFAKEQFYALTKRNLTIPVHLFSL